MPNKYACAKRRGNVGTQATYRPGPLIETRLPTWPDVCRGSRLSPSSVLLEEKAENILRLQTLSKRATHIFFRRDQSRGMGQFSFTCKACGGKEQFDWTRAVVVALKHHTTDKILLVRGRYGSYGDVYVDLCSGAPSEYNTKGTQTTQSPDCSSCIAVAAVHVSYSTLTAVSIQQR